MSDTPQGDGWWQTSDGKWHPPEYDPTSPDTGIAEPTPGTGETPVPPLWSPSAGSGTQPPPEPAAQWGEGQPQWGDQPVEPAPAAVPPPSTAPPGASPPPFSEPYAHEQPTTGQPHASPGTQPFGDQDPLFGGQDPSPAESSAGASGDSGPFGTMRPGEFGLPSAPEAPPEPKIVRPSVFPAGAGPSGPGRSGDGRPSDGRSGSSPVLIWSGVAAAVLLVLFAGWYFLLRSDGSDEVAETPTPTVEGETTVKEGGSSTTEPPETTASLPPKPTIAPGERLPVLNFNDTGDSTVVLEPPGPRVANIEYTGTGPFKVTGLDANGAEVTTLVESEGPYSGSVAVDFRDEQDSRSLAVKAEGAWKIHMVPVETLTPLPGSIAGSGDNVVLYTGGVGPVALSHSGSGPFEVNYFEINTRKITTLVDEQGPYEGNLELRGPAFVWITADGDWSLTPG